MMIDPRTGIGILQITHYPLPSAHFDYHWPSITSDNERMFVYNQRFLRPDAPWDIVRVDIGGGKRLKLTEYGEKAEAGSYYGRPWALLTVDGKYLYVNATRQVHRIEVETGKDEVLVDLGSFWDEGYVLAQMTMSGSGKRIFVQRARPIDRSKPRDYVVHEPDWIIVDLETGATDLPDAGGRIYGCAYDEQGLIVTRGNVVYKPRIASDGSKAFTNPTGQGMLWLVDEKGNNGRPLGEHIYAHGTVLGKKSMIQGCGLPPHRCIWVCEPEKEPYKLVQGPYCWHSSASFDGEWIICDTNWPDQGLQLIHVPTGHMRTLCFPGATQDAPEFGHPHPYLSPDGRIAVFRSDRTGVPQVYVAYVTDEFRESIIAGELDRPNDKWMV